MEHLCQIIKSQPIQSVFQHVIQHTGAEGISGSGGFDYAAQLTGGDEHPLILIVGTTALSPRRYIEEADVGIFFPENGRPFVQIW